MSIVDDARAGDGSGRRGQAAVARHRQEGPERPARGQADRLAHRHQERGREAPRGRGAVRGPRARRRCRSAATRGGDGEAPRPRRRRRRAVETPPPTPTARRGRAPPPAEAERGRRRADGGRDARGRRRRDGPVDADAPAATPRSRPTPSKRAARRSAGSDRKGRRGNRWQQFGFTRSRSCSARRARK